MVSDENWLSDSICGFDVSLDALDVAPFFLAHEVWEVYVVEWAVGAIPIFDDYDLSILFLFFFRMGAFIKIRPFLVCFFNTVSENVLKLLSDLVFSNEDIFFLIEDSKDSVISFSFYDEREEIVFEESSLRDKQLAALYLRARGAEMPCYPCEVNSLSSGSNVILNPCLIFNPLPELNLLRRVQPRLAHSTSA